MTFWETLYEFWVNYLETPAIMIGESLLMLVLLLVAIA
jgi:hypothetical protein